MFSINIKVKFNDLYKILLETLSQDIKNKIIELRKTGLSTPAIGKQLGLSQTAVFNNLPPELKNIGLKGPPALSQDIKNKIIVLRKKGLSTKAIGKQLGISKTSVLRNLPQEHRNIGLKRGRNPIYSLRDSEYDEYLTPDEYESIENVIKDVPDYKYKKPKDLKNIGAKKPSTERKKISSSQEVLDKMIELRKQGLSTSKIGKMLGVSQMTVYNSLPQELKDIGLQSTPQDKKDKIIELRKQGLSLRGISKQVGVSDRAVYYILPPELRNIGLKRGPKLSYFTHGGGI